jgi:hypothetical protein
MTKETKAELQAQIKNLKEAYEDLRNDKGYIEQDREKLYGEYTALNKNFSTSICNKINKIIKLRTENSKLQHEIDILKTKIDVMVGTNVIYIDNVDKRTKILESELAELKRKYKDQEEVIKFYETYYVQTQAHRITEPENSSTPDVAKNACKKCTKAGNCVSHNALKAFNDCWGVKAIIWNCHAKVEKDSTDNHVNLCKTCQNYKCRNKHFSTCCTDCSEYIPAPIPSR